MPPFLTAALPVPHGFFTREGGVSAGRFASLNCSLSGRDDADAVRENRRRAADALGLGPDRLVGLTQVHGVAVATLREAWPETDRPPADAMVTDRPGMLLGIVTGDCAPILFADADAGVVGAAHAGWRGAVAGVVEATIEAMEALGAARTRIAAAVGPCIAQESYEVGPDLRDALLAASPKGEAFLAPGRREARWQFDLPGYCLMRLREAGVASANWVGDDTLANEGKYFSHRRATLAGAGPIGHQLSAIALPER
ncbi:peptidoglycan editing factor PgeF [Falsiroseomonas bella]|uniref:Purine nucleoside phosphorylase n=1 Tax=Falsiroseomonas bella TaxID=2184016 RepID=A0A317FG44_9PROT|nr:peptidoglycan editing factor PgeF [Falsiroseomonas bella]PWS36919.1 peptidoglycan editing factor PgeF [Falsiroseomonas bella]